MFVEIDNKNMDAFKVEEWINRTRDANGGVISPEFAMEILTKTNHFAHIKKVLNNIKKNCLDENRELVADKVLEYKKFILSCVDGREMSPNALEMLSELAEKGGCKDEFAELNSKPKWYYKNDCDNIDIKIVKSEREFQALEGSDLRVFFDVDEIDLSCCDFDRVKNLKFREGAVVDLHMATELPKDLDVSMCSVVYLSGCDLEGFNFKFREGADVYLSSASNLPKDLDVSMCSKVDLRHCDLEGFNFKFREGAEVCLSRAENLPEDLDVSMCSKVDLSGCNLEGVEKITFREGAEVDLMGAMNLPKDLDLSMCSKVDLMYCDLEGFNFKFREGAEVNLIKANNLPKELDVSMCSKVDLRHCDLEGINLKFREGAEVYLSSAENLPKDLDVSMCDVVELWECDLEGLNLKFKEGAEVDLRGAKNLPKELDVSMCSKVNLGSCDLSEVSTITFKDKKQEKIFMEGAKNFSGEVVYADEDKKEKEDNSLFSRIKKRFGSGGMGE